MQRVIYKEKEYLVVSVKEEGRTRCYNKRYHLLPVSKASNKRLYSKEEYESMLIVVDAGVSDDIVKFINDDEYEYKLCIYYKIIKAKK